MIGSVLIANRGEIAARIARTLRRLGIESAGVYAPVDAGAPHTRAVDRAIAIGGGAAAGAGAAGAGALAPYLDIAAIIAAAEAAGAEAVHPGYGFLAENAEAARTVERAGLIWIGPDAEAIARLGDKGEAKRLAAEAGVPVVPGLSEETGGGGPESLSAAAIEAFANEHGYPLMIKAAAGGGGKGMRRIDEGDEIAPALEAARREAIAAFGAGHLVVERLIEPARHIEVQLAVDAAGEAVSLGERECSLQRRHQKLIEESPSPAVSPALRDRLGRAAVDLAGAAGYRNLGTAEFLVDFDDPDRFFFLEINARLQVEHPVTEAVTGLDLVELQLALAAGEALPTELAGITERLSGHAIEARICAERPAAGFLPATGTIARYAEPHGVRVDSGVEEGSTVTADFDPMLAKLIVHAPSREEALARLRRALAEIVTLGVETNAPFLAWLLDRPEVRDGATTTGAVERLVESGAYEQALEEVRPNALAAAVAACAAEASGGSDASRGASPRPGEGFDRADAWRLHGSGWGYWEVRAEPRPQEPGKNHRLAARPSDERFEVGVDDREPTLQAAPPPDRRLVTRDRVEVQGDFGVAGFDFVRELSADATPEGNLAASLPGVVLAVEVKPGQAVTAGQTLLTVESMKMEITVTAPTDGVVATVSVAPGDHVARGQLLAEVTPPSPSRKLVPSRNPSPTEGQIRDASGEEEGGG